MKHFDYYKQDLLNKFLDRKTRIEKEIYALSWISRNYKKDWKDFQNLLQNFKCKDWISIFKKSYPFDDYIYIYHDWQEISIRNYENDEKFLEKIDKSRIIKQEFLKDKVLLNADEILEKIQELLQYKQEYLKKLNTTIETFDITCKEIETLLEPLYNYLEKEYFNFDFEKLIKDMF